MALSELWRLAEAAGDLSVTYMDGEWLIIHQYGLVRDCTLDSAIDASVRLVPGHGPDLPPLTSAILAREQDRRGTHPIDFVNEVHGDPPR